MTKQEAIAEAKKGKKVTHEHFSSYEWMTMQGVMIELEDGVRCDEYEFWRWRTDKSWETGWSIFKEAK